MKICAAWLTYSRQDLSSAMENQIGGIDCYVIDNGSPIPIVSEHATVLRKEENGFFTGGWNWAMRKLAQEYDYVWMLNDDLQGCTAWKLQQIARIMDGNPDIAVLTPSFNSPHPVFSLSSPPTKNGIRPVKWIDWCCPVVRCAAWLEVGEFDEDFKGYGADLIWCKTAREHGWKFGVFDTVIIHHLGSQTARSTGLADTMCSNENMSKVMLEKYGIDNFWSLT